MSHLISQQPTFASFYDFYDGPEHRQTQLQMYRDLASEAGDPILELACGTGIITLDLARAGFQVTGVDKSSEVLEVARERIAREDAEVRSRITLAEADMKDVELGQTFGAVFVTGNSFGYLTDMAAQRSCLRAVHGHLRPGGLLVIQERNYTPETLMGMLTRQRAITLQAAGVNSTTGKYTTFNSITVHIDFPTQTILRSRFIDETQADGTVKRYVPADDWAHRGHYFGRFELQLLIEDAGFTIRDVWGDYDRQPLRRQSYTVIFVAEKR